MTCRLPPGLDPEYAKRRAAREARQAEIAEEQTTDEVAPWHPEVAGRGWSKSSARRAAISRQIRKARHRR